MKYSYLINKKSVYNDFGYFVTYGGRESATCFDRSFGHLQAMNDRYSIALPAAKTSKLEKYVFI